MTFRIRENPNIIKMFKACDAFLKHFEITYIKSKKHSWIIIDSGEESIWADTWEKVESMGIEDFKRFVADIRTPL